MEIIQKVPFYSLFSALGPGFLGSREGGAVGAAESAEFHAVHVTTYSPLRVLAIEYAILKERFDNWNLTYLKLEAEDTPSSIEQLNVRVQSFVESLL